MNRGVHLWHMDMHRIYARFAKTLLLISALLVMHGGVASAQPIQEIKTVDLDWYKKLVSNSNDTTYVIKFWATWCVPCVAEIPYFEKLREKYRSQKIRVVLLSLDNMKELDTKLIPFVVKKGINSEVYLFAQKGLDWIDEVDSRWTGAIPFTLIINNKRQKRVVLEKEISFAELDSEIKKTISK